MDNTTCPIKLERGVLQGDCLSTPLFNLCFNTLIRSVKQRKVNCLGCVLDYTLQPRHWFQFADDSAAATSSIQDNQYLLNLFTKWSVWANFVVRVDKCKSFGITKNVSQSFRFEPNLVICREKIPAVGSNMPFEYLEKKFNFEMKINEVLEELEKRVISYLTVIDKLPLHPKFKIQILTRYVFSKIRWTLWVSNNLVKTEIRFQHTILHPSLAQISPGCQHNASHPALKSSWGGNDSHLRIISEISFI